LFGDGAAASWITACAEGEGLLDVACGTAGRFYDKFIVPARGCRRPHADRPENSEPRSSPPAKPPDTIHMEGTAILAFVNSKIPTQVRELLERNGLSVQDVDLFVFHQASQMVLDTLPGLLKIRPEQTYSNLAEVGNTVSASIPIALKDGLDAGRLAAGDTVVICGFGLGLSWASALLKWT
jgi:3-oxoacyl-[acyl-carrier-protein] synthase-3